MAPKELDRLATLLQTFDHEKGIALFDELAKDPANAGPILQELLLTAANHDDPALHTPHGPLTLHAARELLLLTRPPGGLGLLRFLVLYNFSLTKRTLSVAQAEANARAIPPGDPADMALAYRKAVTGGLGGQAAALLCRIALDRGLERALHLAVRTSLDDLGRLGHNLAAAAAHSEAASALRIPRGLVPLANLGHAQAAALRSVPAVTIPEISAAPAEEPDVVRLGELVDAWEFEHVERVLQALAAEGQADVAYRPLLVAASADPGFLGHTLSLAHAAREATRYLTPSENAWLLWKLYRTLTTHFGYPEFLRLGAATDIDPGAIRNALDSSLRHKSPPAEATVRQALEAGTPVEDVLAQVVDFYGNWTVGEKEHTISYLNAALQTAKFLGREEALLPLAIALSKLPF